MQNFVTMDIGDINNYFGDIDLFLMDYILKGKVSKGSHVLDAGCGSGRNLIYFLQNDFQVSAVDKAASEVSLVKYLARTLEKPVECHESDLIDLPFKENSFDLIICSRVLHFAENEEQFFKMMRELKRTLDDNGILYLSMDSLIGMDQLVKEIEPSKYELPDGSIRFLLTTEILKTINKEWYPVEHSRTVRFDNSRAETTLILRKV